MAENENKNILKNILFFHGFSVNLQIEIQFYTG